MSALIVAAGRGCRLGGRVAKQFLRLRGVSLVEWSLAAFEAAPGVDEVWLVLPPGRLGMASALRRRYRKLRGAVTGGAERGDSVARGLARVRHDGVVLVHDAARPFVRPDLIARVVRAARRHGAAVPALPVADALKRAAGRRVAGTLDRGGLWTAQTPQAFRTSLLRRAYQGGGGGDPDDAARVERSGRRVALVAGSALNFKVTRGEDLRLARLVAQGLSPARR